jgi:hypothetical protein
VGVHPVGGVADAGLEDTPIDGEVVPRGGLDLAGRLQAAPVDGGVGLGALGVGHPGAAEITPHPRPLGTGTPGGRVVVGHRRLLIAP